MPTVPYLYGQQSQYSQIDPSKHDFDPKAYTRASWQPAPPPKSEPSGPLLDFNKHPDSYLFLPYGNTNAEPLPPNTGKRIKTVRWIQLSVRVLTLLGALGLLFCVIVIKNLPNPSSWIVRIPAGVDILTSGYAIYHLARSVKSRPPASAASYHFFALVIDISLIPFYIFTAMLAKSATHLNMNDTANWESYFPATTTTKIVLSTFLISVVIGAMHLISAMISLYLVFRFRKIMHLPPDMNPFETNLTSRRSTKHKHKNSEMSTSSISGPTLINSTNQSLNKLGISSPVRERMLGNAPIPFLHTRQDADYAYSPHNPKTAAEASRSNLEIPQIPAGYQQPRSERNSRMDLAPPVNPWEGHSSSGTKYSHRFTSEPSSHLPTMRDTSSVYSSNTMATKSSASPPLPRKSSKRQSLPSENWQIYESDSEGDLGGGTHRDNADPAISIIEEDDEYEPYRPYSGSEDNAARPTMPSNSSARGFNFGMLRNPTPAYSSVPQNVATRSAVSLHDLVAPQKAEDDFIPDPLGMHPPTPELRPEGELQQQQQEAPRRAAPAPQPFTRIGEKPLADTSGNTTAPPRNAAPSLAYTNRSGASTPKKSVGTPTKTRYYGDLSSAMAGVRGQTPSPSPPKKWAQWETQGRETQGSPKISVNPATPTKTKPERRDWAEKAQDGGQKGRVISRSGADGGYEGFRGEKGLRGRNVSGKVAEEGRGGVGWRAW